MKVLKLTIQAGYSRLLLLEDKPHKSTVSLLLESRALEEYSATERLFLPPMSYYVQSVSREQLRI